MNIRLRKPLFVNKSVFSNYFIGCDCTCSNKCLLEKMGNALSLVYIAENLERTRTLSNIFYRRVWFSSCSFFNSIEWFSWNWEHKTRTFACFNLKGAYVSNKSLNSDSWHLHCSYFCDDLNLFVSDKKI